MNSLPTAFRLILLGFGVGALVLAITGFLHKQRRVERLKDPHRDHLRRDDDR